MSGIECFEFIDDKYNSRVGYASFLATNGGYRVYDLPVFKKGEQRWIGNPSAKDKRFPNEKKYRSTFEFNDKRINAKFLVEAKHALDNYLLNQGVSVFNEE